MKTISYCLFTIACCLTISLCLLPVASYAWDDSDVKSETYLEHSSPWDKGLNPPGSRLNPYVTKQTDSYGNTRTYETHQKVWTPPGYEHNPVTQPGTRLNPWVTERVR